MRNYTYLLHRVTSGRNFLPEVDGLRFFATSFVVIHHAHFILLDSLPRMDQTGIFGMLYLGFFSSATLAVPLFFIISAMILGIPFANQHINGGKSVNIRAYFLRRLTRLEPPFLINMFLLFGLLWLAKGNEFMTEQLPHFIAAITYMHTLIYSTWNEINFVSWSLETEAQYYILAPLVAIALYKWGVLGRRWLVLLLIAVACAWRLWLLQDPQYWQLYSIIGLSQFFLAGYLMADLKVTDQLGPHRLGPLLDVGAIAAFTIAVLMELGKPGAWAPAFTAFPLLAFVYLSLRGRFLPLILRQPWMHIPGGMCYTIYLYHYWIMLVAVRVLGLDETIKGIGGQIAVDAFLLLGVVGGSAVLFVLFERPFMFRNPGFRNMFKPGPGQERQAGLQPANP